MQEFLETENATARCSLATGSFLSATIRGVRGFLKVVKTREARAEFEAPPQTPRQSQSP